ncbi:MAG: hypothetical protein JXB32_01520 [Deltaproteobacteria bacterium]|nr:hypothetical protein [Deltaproteobacteria bacterium]
MTEVEPSGEPESPLPELGSLAEPAGGAEAQDALERVYRSIRWRVFGILTLATTAIVATGALLLLASLEVTLVLVPLLLVIEFASGFMLSGRLMALALARHHDRLRTELLAEQEQTRRALVERWRSLGVEQREGLRRRFPDVDWGAIDDLAGTVAEAGTKH